MAGRSSHPGRQPEPTPQERELVHGVLAHKSQAQAARDAGYPAATPLQAAKAGSTVLARPQVREYLRELTEKRGFGDDRLIELVIEGLSAELFVIDRNGARHTGPDHKARLGYLDMLWRLRDRYPNPKLDIDVHGTIEVVTLQPEDVVGGRERAIDVTPERAYSSPLDSRPS